jgi:hypothetical protein
MGSQSAIAHCFIAMVQNDFSRLQCGNAFSVLSSVKIIKRALWNAEPGSILVVA